ncbi:uncharacterized protein BKCO1_760008 [Diplodia corticola]|uniref:F-box domain-containing protein n=1 Tax=Diplodia corticola TaxID=236234 RepID=A0A1J9RB09_9PEZI|nr:uncharacterized protein BKCO1_760008 [Diplodia corticola]OJD29611.1 hypothetical protein BKCO1_760008 [Diplodia corticola]
MDDEDKWAFGYIILVCDVFSIVMFQVILNEPDLHDLPLAFWAFLVLILPVPCLVGTLAAAWWCFSPYAPCLVATLTRAWFAMGHFQDLMRKLRGCRVAPAPKSRHLPDELVLAIVAYLPAADALALRATCRHFRRMYYPHAATLDDRADLASRCRRDHFARTCLAELDGALKHGLLVCSYCRATHPRSLFSPLEQTRALQWRRCLGATTALALCPHRQLRHEDLAALGDDGIRKIEGADKMLRCDRCDAEVYKYALRPLVSKRAVFERTYFRMQVPRYRSIPHPTLAAAIAAAVPTLQHLPVCAHLDAERLACRLPEPWLHLPQFGPRTTKYFYCNKLGCRTFFLLVCEESESYGAFVIALKSNRTLHFTTETGAVHDDWMEACTGVVRASR